MIFANVLDWVITEGSVKRVTDSLGNILWEKQGGHDYSQDYFFVEDASGSANTLTIKKSSSNSNTLTVYKSTDQVNWSSMGSTNTTGITATIPANGKLYLKCTTTAWGNVYNTSSFLTNTIKCSGNHNVGGNIMSLIKGANFQNTTLDSTNKYAFQSIFTQSDNLISAGNLIMPSYIPEKGCFKMFDSCTSLTTAPNLPATTIETEAYNYLFYRCSALTTAPLAINATELPTRACSQMFSGCTNLVTPPSIQATVLSGNQCCYGMFYNCTSLTTAPVLPATTLAYSCYEGMFEGCTSLTTAPALPATTLAQSCYAFMFSGCTALTTAPALPATTLANYCYHYMFYACRSLNNITTYATTIQSNSITNWLLNVAATGDFYNLGGATYTSGASGIPAGWTEHNTL